MFLFLSAAEWSSRTWISPWNRPAGRCGRLPEAEPQAAEDSGISDLSQSDSGSECLTSTGQFEDAGSIPSPVAELFLQVKEESPRSVLCAGAPSRPVHPPAASAALTHLQPPHSTFLILP
ncbi:hypothetical protein CgunFtcFv8_011144 [Champsocephalus gunnari]|uniref:Uncharacterized protein n=1 Tax=Champsocephalus gunnari TaxID=52237 RepID=A0AAN8DVQ5_CHAGU|nr:hypothetical protein CgunFtcFv8_011144 [Champsocephalus gunnari]